MQVTAGEMTAHTGVLVVWGPWWPEPSTGPWGFVQQSF